MFGLDLIKQECEIDHQYRIFDILVLALVFGIQFDVWITLILQLYILPQPRCANLSGVMNFSTTYSIKFAKRPMSITFRVSTLIECPLSHLSIMLTALVLNKAVLLYL